MLHTSHCTLHKVTHRREAVEESVELPVASSCELVGAASCELPSRTQDPLVIRSEQRMILDKFSFFSKTRRFLKNSARSTEHNSIT